MYAHNIISEALIRKYPKQEYQLADGKITYWDATTIPEPTPEELSTIVGEFLESIGDTPIEDISLSWFQLRKKYYPPIEHQLDMIYHDFDGWKNVITAIKEKYPKID